MLSRYSTNDVVSMLFKYRAVPPTDRSMYGRVQPDAVQIVIGLQDSFGRIRANGD